MRFSNFVLSAALAILSTVPSAFASPVFPAGTRASLVVPAGDPAVFGLNASGPSVLWIVVEGEGLVELTATSAEASAAAIATRKGAHMGTRAELAFPVYASGVIDVRVSAAAGSRISITSSYGFGAVVTMRDLLDALPDDESDWDLDDQEKVVSNDLPEVKPRSFEQTEMPVAYDASLHQGIPADGGLPSTPSMDSASIHEPIRPAEQPASVEDEPSLDEPPAADPLAAAPHAVEPPPASAEPEPVVHDKSRAKGVLFGEGAEGQLAGEANSATYRCFIPNAENFQVIAWGDVDVTVSSRTGDFSRTVSRRETIKTVTVSTAIESMYYISVRGTGRYTIEVSPR